MYIHYLTCASNSEKYLYICLYMKKDTVFITRMEPELKAHIEKTAKKLGIGASEYARAVLKKASNFKEKPIV